jgi:hypothetical protein
MPGSFILNDLSAVFSTADFAETARVDSLYDVDGIFEDETVDVSRSEDRSALVRQVTFQVPSTSRIALNSVVVVKGVTYIAKQPDYDGTGTTTWYLARQ